MTTNHTAVVRPLQSGRIARERGRGEDAVASAVPLPRGEGCQPQADGVGAVPPLHYTNDTWTVDAFISYLPAADRTNSYTYLMIAQGDADDPFTFARYVRDLADLTMFIKRAIAAGGHRVPSRIWMVQGLRRYVWPLVSLEMIEFSASRRQAQGMVRIERLAHQILDQFERGLRADPALCTTGLPLAEINTRLTAWLQAEGPAISRPAVTGTAGVSPAAVPDAGLPAEARSAKAGDA
ncbi:MAG: hypothetical protein AAB368_05390 [bacterium]